MNAPSVTDVPAAVRHTVATVPDPEYPGVSIIELGLVEHVSVLETAEGFAAVVDLIPTFSGCPALTMIADDVRSAVGAVAGVSSCEVRWLTSPVWSTERISPSARSQFRDEFTVVLRRKDGRLRCPVCGSDAVEDQASAGPTRCRSVAWCGACRNVVEVMR